jgi:GT2 family glycosyltransferase
MPAPPDLSIIIDLETMEITGDILLDRQVALWLQAAQRIAPKTFELIICTRQQAAIPPHASAHVKIIRGTGEGYYALKNEAARQASGTYLFFSDVDCRPEPDFFVRLLHYFETTGALILGGRTFYDGRDFASRACTVVSFGRLHGVDQVPPLEWYLAHNIAIRRDAFPACFGPYTGRYGGDEFITACARERGLPLPVYQDLILHHESAAHSFRGLMDRHLREIIRTAFVAHGAKLTPAQVFRQARKTGRERWLTFKKRASRFNFSPRERRRARWLFKRYQLLDMLCVLVFFLRPRLLARWIAYQFGDVTTCSPVLPVPPDSSTHDTRLHPA